MELQGFIILIKYRLLIQSSSNVNCLMKNQRTEHLSAYDP